MNDAIAVKMSDGRTVSFGKLQRVKKTIIEGVGVRFDARNGETFTAEISELSTDTIDRCALHGLSQKLGDEYAGDEYDTAEKCLSAARALWERLTDGAWHAEREGGGRESILSLALQKVFGKSADEVSAILKVCNRKEKDALKLVPSVAKAITAIETERGKGVDTTVILAKFGG